LILRFGKKNDREDYQLAKCTFKPQTNKNFAFQNTSKLGTSMRSYKRPGSTAQPSTSANYQQSLTSQLYTKNAAGGKTIDRILNGRKRLNGDLILDQSFDVELTMDKSMNQDSKPARRTPHETKDGVPGPKQVKRTALNLSNISQAISGASSFMNSSYL